MNKQLWGFKNMWKRGYADKHVKAESKQKKTKKKLTFLGNGITHARMSSTGVRRLDHAYADPYPENQIYTKTEQKPNKI